MLRRAVLLGYALLLAACAAAAPPAQPAPTSPPPDPVVVCTNQITYWAGEDLGGAPDGSYDYQHRGLTSEQNDVLTELVGQARVAGWSAEQLAEQARTACAALVAARPGGY